MIRCVSAGSSSVPTRKFSTPNRWYASVQGPNAFPQTAAESPSRSRSRRMAANGAWQAGRWRKSGGMRMSSEVFQIGLPLSGMASGSPQSTLQPSAATSWQTEKSGMTTSRPRMECPATARRAMASTSRWARGKKAPVRRIRSTQAIYVPVPSANCPGGFARRNAFMKIFRPIAVS